jgi:omega-hydroxy-beta-dihydromenaquinone-9 sulfotransferase
MTDWRIRQSLSIFSRGAAMGTGQDAKAKAEQKSGYKDRFWIPRFWDGMCLSGWFRLLARNRFAMAPSCIAMAVLVAMCGSVNFVLWLFQYLLFGRKIARTEIKGDPIFVIGHWRSGTTLLHELLVLDSRHTYPDTYACFAPNHFLVSRWCVKPWLRFLLPAQRPMDNMLAGWDHPQEDEFALCNMGVPSPYLTNAFPNRPPQYPEYLDLHNVPAPAVAQWKQALLWFLKCVTLQNPKRIVLKSPPHTCRISTLLEMFPKAKFLHIVRDPYVIFPSTINLWKRLYRDQGVQVPTYDGLEERVFTTFTRMYETFERERSLIGRGQFCEVRYENLVANPIAEMRRVYEELQLGDFETVRPAMEDYFAGKKDYKTNRYQMTPELRTEITRRWGTFIRQYGYAAKEVEKKERVVEPAAKKPLTVS